MPRSRRRCRPCGPRPSPRPTITIENQEWQVYLNTLLPDAPLDEKPDVYRMGWCADYPDADNWLIGVFNSKSDQNYAMFNNPEFDAAVDEADSDRDPARARSCTTRRRRILIDDVTAIAPIYYYTYVRLYKPWLTNVVISPVTGDPDRRVDDRHGGESGCTPVTSIVSGVLPPRAFSPECRGGRLFRNSPELCGDLYYED